MMANCNLSKCQKIQPTMQLLSIAKGSSELFKYLEVHFKPEAMRPSAAFRFVEA